MGSRTIAMPAFGRKSHSVLTTPSPIQKSEFYVRARPANASRFPRGNGPNVAQSIGHRSKFVGVWHRSKKYL